MIMMNESFVSYKREEGGYRSLTALLEVIKAFSRSNTFLLFFKIVRFSPLSKPVSLRRYIVRVLGVFY